MSFLARILGIPVSAADRDAVLAVTTANRSREESIAFFRDGAQHNTAKSGALLGAQGIFAVVAIFALDHGWPKNIVLASLLVMLAGSLLVMTNLRGTLRPYMAARGTTPEDPVRRVYNLVLKRSAIFNVALYLTFLSIVLLAVAALTFVV